MYMAQFAEGCKKAMTPKQTKQIAVPTNRAFFLPKT